MKKYMRLLIIILIGFVFLNSCKKRVQEKTFTIGAVLPLSGPIASYGINSQNGINIATAEIHAKDNIKINVIYEDDAGQVQNAVSATNKLIYSNQVPLIIGEASSGYSLAIAPICNKSKVILCSPVSSAAELTEKGGDYFFRVCPSDAFQARILAKWLKEENKMNVSLLYVNSDWGTSLKNEFTKYFLPEGGTIIANESCEEGDRDFKTQIAKINKPEAQAIVSFTPPKEGGIFVRQVREMNIKLPLYGGDFWGTPEFTESGGEATEGVYFTFPANPTGTLFEQFADKYHKKYNKEPDVYAAYAYDLTNIVGNAIKSGVSTGEKIRQYLLKMETYEGVTGPTKFDQNGDVITKTFDRVTISNGKHVSIK